LPISYLNQKGNIKEIVGLVKEVLLMKKYILAVLCILCIGIFSSCQKEKVFKFPKDDIQSLTVHINNFNSGVTTSKMVFENDDMKDFLSYLENLEGTKIDNIDTGKLSRQFYGVELHAT
jgi:hypothetical protein